MDFSSDEIRRQVTESQREHEAAMPAFAEALDTAFDPDARIDTDAKAELLSLPSRRGLLRIGGTAVGLAALAAACVPGTKKSQITQTGQAPTTTKAPDTTLTPGTTELDATLVLTAISIEYLAVETYQLALDSGRITTPAIASAASYFQGQHRDHAGALEKIARDLGQEPTNTPNEWLMTNQVAPRARAATSEQAMLQLALELEDTAAQTYVKAGGVLTVPTLRNAIMSIGGVEARHVLVLRHVTFADEFPSGALYPTQGAAPRASWIEPKTDSLPSTTAPTTVAPTTTAAGAAGTTKTTGSM